MYRTNKFHLPYSLNVQLARVGSSTSGSHLSWLVDLTLMHCRNPTESSATMPTPYFTHDLCYSTQKTYRYLTQVKERWCIYICIPKSSLQAVSQLKAAKQNLNLKLCFSSWGELYILPHVASSKYTHIIRWPLACSKIGVTQNRKLCIR